MSTNWEIDESGALVEAPPESLAFDGTAGEFSPEDAAAAAGAGVDLPADAEGELP